MSRRELPGGREDVLGDRVEDAWVLSENTNIKDFLWVAKPEMLKLGVEARFLGSKVWDTQAG